MTMQFLSPAKINWFLHTVGKRQDGYHALQTFFQFIDLCDEMHFTSLPHPSLVVKNMSIPLEQNLIYKAAKQLQRLAPNKGIEIAINKRIPMGGGLGGGSSNAATTLLALNHLWELHLTEKELLQEALQLGADVPVFVKGRACWGEGVGELLTPYDYSEKWLLLIAPDCQISTKELFQHPELTRECPPCRIEALKQSENLSFVPPQFYNVFEPIVRKLYTAVADAMDWLNQFSLAKLSGTGCCVFAPFESKEEAFETADKLPSKMRGWVVKTLNSRP